MVARVVRLPSSSGSVRVQSIRYAFDSHFAPVVNRGRSFREWFTERVETIHGRSIFRWVNCVSGSVENKEEWYGCLLETDVLSDLDSVHILPSSLYLLLFNIATLSGDPVSSESACSLYLSLLQRHVSFQLDFVRCLPPGETYLSTLDLLGYSESAIDVELLLRTHKEYRDEINWDGSLRPCRIGGEE